MIGRTLVLDIQSRNRIREVLIQGGIGVALMALLFAVRAQSLAELGQSAVRVFTFYSVIDCFRASRRREPIWGASLTRWDQATAYGLCAVLIDIVMKWPGGAL